MISYAWTPWRSKSSTLITIFIFQGVFMMYLYVGSIVAIMCIYITVLLDNCPSLTGRSSREPLTNEGDPETGSLASFGTLRRAHIDRTKVSRTSFYLRVGALGMFLLNNMNRFGLFNLLLEFSNLEGDFYFNKKCSMY